MLLNTASIIWPVSFWLLFSLLLRLGWGAIYLKWFQIGIIITVAFACLMGLAIQLIAPLTSSVTFCWLLLITLNAFTLPTLYKLDKHRAKATQYERIPELVLHLLALMGGGFGAYLGQHLWRHKTQKWLFKLTNFLGMSTALLIGYWLQFQAA